MDSKENPNPEPPDSSPKPQVKYVDCCGMMIPEVVTAMPKRPRAEEPYEDPSY